MAKGIDVGAGGVKSLKSCYVGAGGVKKATAIYIGAGGVKKVWPGYTVGQNILDINTDNWTGYHSLIDSGGTVTGWEEYMSIVSGRILVTWYGGCQRGCGGYISTKVNIDGSGLKYIGVEAAVTDSASNVSYYPRYTVYASIGSSKTSLPSSDTGGGAYADVERVNTNYFRQYFLLDLTSCSRSGYLKFGYILTQNRTIDLNDWGDVTGYKFIVGDTTNFSDYGFSGSYGTSWTGTIKIT